MNKKLHETKSLSSCGLFVLFGSDSRGASVLACGAVATTGVTLRRANFQLPPVKNFDEEFEVVDTIGKG